MSDDLSPNTQIGEESFASRTENILHLYNSLMQSSRARLKEIEWLLSTTKRKPIWQNVLDLRIMGTALLVTAISLKFFSVRNDDKILETSEFIVVFVVASLFLILGTYFNIKELQDARKLIEKENETTTANATAFVGLMNAR